MITKDRSTKKHHFYSQSHRRVNPCLLVLVMLISALSTSLGQLAGTIPIYALSTAPAITQEGYVFENIDGTSADVNTQQAGSEFSSGKTLTSVRKGESINLRMHITNTGSAVDSNDIFGLFYDRNDGIWTKVQQTVPAMTNSGTGCSNSDYTCIVVDDQTDALGYATDIAFDNTGRPWVAYNNTVDASIIVAKYVGSGGNCDTYATGSAGSDAWECTVVDDRASMTETPRLSIDQSGKPWVAYQANMDNLVVAYYVGSGGDCDTYAFGSAGSDAWECTVVDDQTDGVGTYNNITISPSGSPWVSYRNFTDKSLVVANYVGSGGNCDTYASGSAGSDAWQCTVVDYQTDEVAAFKTSIVFDASGNPWVSYHNATDKSLLVANYVSSGGDCDTYASGSAGSDAWECTVVDDQTNTVGTLNDIAFSPSGSAWISYNNGSTLSLVVSQYVGSGGDCDTYASGSAGSDAWECTIVDDQSDSVGSLAASIAFDPSGTAWIGYLNSTDYAVMWARYVGSGGNCDTYATGSSGSDAWQCTVVNDTANSPGYYISTAFAPTGIPWMSYFDSPSNSLVVVLAERKGEITTTSSPVVNGATSTESHADMTSSTDTTNRDDADCLVSATWNNGRYISSENGKGLSIGTGTVTAQCSEVIWTIDTSQAKPGTIYRFVVASNDNWQQDRGSWRGPISIATDGYPTLTIMGSGQQELRYSKATTGVYGSDCADTAWSCTNIDVTDEVGEMNAIAFSPDNIPWIAYFDETYDNLEVAYYVGSGGNCDTLGAGSDAWQCATVDATNTIAKFGIDILFDFNGVPWIAYEDDTAGDLKVAKYVGSGGNCDDTGGSDAWQCTVVYAPSSTWVAYDVDMELDPAGNIWITHADGTNNDLELARYVGSGGNCDSYNGSDAWQCETIDATGDLGFGSALTFDANGKAKISYESNSSASPDIKYAEYVGSGGTGCAGGAVSTAWQCTTILTTNDVGDSTDIAVDSSGTTWITFTDTTNGYAKIAKYVGGTSGSGCTSSAWTCYTLYDGSWSGYQPHLAIDSTGVPWASFYDLGSVYNLIVARYVGSGGNCDDSGGSDAWQCSSVDTSGSVGEFSTIAFDYSGIPWVAFKDVTNGNLRVARMKMPPNKLSGLYLNPRRTGNAGTGDLAYILSSGESPTVEASVGICGSSTSNQQGICGLHHPEGNLDSLTTKINERPIYGFATKYDSTSELPSVGVYYQTDLAPNTSGTTGDVVLQVYRFGSTNAWETIATDSTSASCSANCTLSGAATGTVSEYFETIDSKYWVYFRVYQTESASTAINFKFDSFKATQTTKQLRHGAVFKEEFEDPMNW